MSPKQQQKLYSEAQKQLYLYQRETLAAHAAFQSTKEKPDSPRLEPLGSPGPVTPLELEGQEGYLIAGVRAAGQSDISKELVEKLIEQEAMRNNDALQPPRSPTAVASR